MKNPGLEREDTGFAGAAFTGYGAGLAGPPENPRQGR